jgi:hypothetical protein
VINGQRSTASGIEATRRGRRIPGAWGIIYGNSIHWLLRKKKAPNVDLFRRMNSWPKADERIISA